MRMDPKLRLMAERARAAYAESVQNIARPAGWETGTVRELRVPTSAGPTRILLYAPNLMPGGRLPVFVNIHGGGFIQGSAEDDDVWCRRIVDAVGCAVVSIDYCLAPEHPFPAALEECYDVLKWIRATAQETGFDPARVAVGGHSAGGNLTAALCLLARERREFSICYQILNYPPLDFSVDPFSKPGGDTLLTPRAQAFFTSCYLADPRDAVNPLASPLLEENLAGLPGALIIAAEKDPLCGEDALYAERLSAAGTDVTFRMFRGCMHAFTHFGPPDQAEEAWGLIEGKLRQAFARPS